MDVAQSDPHHTKFAGGARSGCCGGGLRRRGAPMAYELARKGYAVAIVEEGHYYKRADFTGQRIEMMSKVYRNKGLSFCLSNAPIWIPTGKCVGGTTTINSGTCMRPPKNVIERWEASLG